MKPGILNSVLVEQVRGTAAWLWQEPPAAPLTAIFDEAVDEPLEAPGALVAELEREERAFEAAVARGAPATTALALATTIAHNLGDLSRVVDAWPQAARASELHGRYSRLGHADARRQRNAFVLAGVLNKELMASENHRFLALHKPRALRRGRPLLLPVGPWFDAWGETVCRSELLEEGDRAEVVTALVELHLRSPTQEGCLRGVGGDRACDARRSRVVRRRVAGAAA